MTRRLQDWLASYVQYTQHTEAPRIIHAWAGVSAIAAALRRRVWFDQVYFRWFPSFYIIFVGPPGVITKSTTAGNSLDIMQSVQGIKFGPDEVTWQSLVTTFAAACESFMVGDEIHPMSALTLISSELGILIDFEDRKMINLFITLWDGLKKFEKKTKTSGDDMVEAPWINILGCTTPQWIAENMSASTVGGGFTSRCIFVYGDQKEHLVANIKKELRGRLDSIARLREDLIHDLEHISITLAGEYQLAPEAEEWYDTWYANLWRNEYSPERTDFENGQVARRQTHLTKLAMILAASARDELVITLEDLQMADLMLKEVGKNAHKVFQKIGRTPESLSTDRLLDLIRLKKKMQYREAYKVLHSMYGDARVIDGLMKGAIDAGYVTLDVSSEGAPWLIWKGGD